MRLRYARITTAGPVREINEDYLDFWESEDPLVREQKGSVALLADGVGGLDRGARLQRAEGPRTGPLGGGQCRT